MDTKGAREILFRGKRIDNGEWVEGNYCAAEYITSDGIEHLIIEVPRNGCSAKINPETVGQYTGLTDKNDKKIFEGDIMAFTAYEFDYVGTVEFADGSFSIMCEHTSPFLDQAVSKHGAYIIGNIHDNPELLNGAE